MAESQLHYLILGFSERTKYEGKVYEGKVSINLEGRNTCGPWGGYKCKPHVNKDARGQQFRKKLAEHDARHGGKIFLLIK